MKIKSTVFFLLPLLSVVYSTQSLATAGSCNYEQGTTGKIVSVNLGWDDDGPQNIAFNYKRTGYPPHSMSVKRTVGDASGHAMYQLLLTAMLTQSNFKIIRCETDQLISGEIIID